MSHWVSDEGKTSAWVGIHASALKGMILLALKLKLSPQARSPKTPKVKASPVSFYDRVSDDADEDQRM